MQAITEIDGDTAIVTPLHFQDRPKLAALLLAAAGPGNARAVRSQSVKGGGRAYVVPVAVAEAAGLIPAEAEPFDAGGVTGGMQAKTVTEPQQVLSAEQAHTFASWLEAEAAFKAKEPTDATPTAPAESEPGEPAKKAPAKKAAPKAVPRGKATTAKSGTGDADSGDTPADAATGTGDSGVE